MPGRDWQRSTPLDRELHTGPSSPTWTLVKSVQAKKHKPEKLLSGACGFPKGKRTNVSFLQRDFQ